VKINLIFAAILTVLAAPAVVLAWEPDPVGQRALVDGKTLVEVAPGGEGANVIHAAVDIAAPPKVVWAVMNDCRLAKKLAPSVTSCTVLQGDAEQGWDLRETFTRGNLFVPTIRNVVRTEYQPYSTIRFSKAGGDLRIEEGEWRFEPLDSGAATRVIYVYRVAVSVPAPASMVRDAMRKSTARLLVNLRRESLAQARYAQLDASPSARSGPTPATPPDHP
jgi:carbon monoxide dehydrogenase subunit G